MAKPTDPKRDGFTFVDWYTDEATTLAYDFATPVTANLTLYAKWTANAATLANDIVFAPLTDADKTVIGMREFLLTVTYNNLTEKDSLVFIVGESSTPPDWSAVENHPAKITRSFDNAEKQTREIYFSATEAYLTNGGGVVDLSTDAETKFPGMMAPKSDYYVHAYAGRSHVKSSPKITTADYPASLPPAITDERSAADPTKADNFLRALWGMEMWTRRADGTALNLDDETINAAGKYILNIRTIEIRTEEVVYFPFRFIPPHSTTQSICFGGTIGKSLVSVVDDININIGTQYNIIELTYPQAGFHTGNPVGQSVLFTKKYSSNYYDVMAIITDGSVTGSPLSIYWTSDCIQTTVRLYLLGFGIRQIAE